MKGSGEYRDESDWTLANMVTGCFGHDSPSNGLSRWVERDMFTEIQEHCSPKLTVALA